MTKEKFIKYAKQGKTVITMDFVQGMEGLCTTGVSGDPKLILMQLTQKTALVFHQLENFIEEKDMLKIIDMYTNSLKETYKILFLSDKIDTSEVDKKDESDKSGK